MILFVTICSNEISLKTEVETEKKVKTPNALKALVHIGCKGKKKCMDVKIKNSKCGDLAKFSLAPVKAALRNFRSGLIKKDIKLQKSASNEFIKAMKPVTSCNVCPKSIKIAFSKGFKITDSKKKAKKTAKKAKKSLKKAKKAHKKAHKKGHKKAHKKSDKKAHKKGHSKRGKKVRKVVYMAIVNFFKSLLRLC